MLNGTPTHRSRQCVLGVTQTYFLIRCLAMADPARRILIVLTTLVAMMILAASLLLMFEPGGDVLKGISLSAVTTVDEGEGLTDDSPVPAGGQRADDPRDEGHVGRTGRGVPAHTGSMTTAPRPGSRPGTGR